MKNDYLRRYLLVHTWAGVAGALILFIAFYAGSFTMYAPEISRWARAYDHHVPVVKDADALWERFLQQAPDTSRATLILDADGWPVPAVQTGNRYSVLTPDGTLVDLPLAGEGVGTVVDDIHRRGGLPLPRVLAERVVGVVALIYVVALVSGVILIATKLLRDLFVMRLNRSIKRRWLDGHNLLGIGNLPFHFIIAFTTAVFCLHDWVFDAQDTLVYPQGLESAMVLPAPAPGSQPKAASEWQPPTALVSGLQRDLPGFKAVAIAYRGMGSGEAVAMVAGADDRHFKRSPRVGYALLNPANGQLLESTYVPGQQASLWASWLIPLFALHFGSFGGDGVLFLYFVLGALGALLFYTGNRLWVISRTRRARRDGTLTQARHVAAIAAFNEGIALGTVAGLPAALAISRWSSSLFQTGSITEAATWAFYTCLLLFLALAFWRGADRSQSLLLWLAALANASVPLTSAAAFLSTGHYMARFWPMEVLLLVAALGLGYLARRQGRRRFDNRNFDNRNKDKIA